MKKFIIFAIIAVAAVIASNFFFTSCNKDKKYPVIFPQHICGEWVSKTPTAVEDRVFTLKIEDVAGGQSAVFTVLRDSLALTTIDGAFVYNSEDGTAFIHRTATGPTVSFQLKDTIADEIEFTVDLLDGFGEKKSSMFVKK